MSGAHPERWASAAVRGLAPYVPGKPISELERELGTRDIVKLASNENPIGPSPLAVRAMHEALGEAWVYPDGSGHDLKTALARHHGVGVEAFTLGNGSNDLLVLLAEAFLAPGCEAVYSQYCFAIYPLVVQATGATGRCVPARSCADAMPFGHDLEAMARAVNERTRLVFIANPNNPTGTWEGSEALRQFIEAVPSSTLVVLDEAYYDYARAVGCQDGIEWLAAHPNLVVLRTFSKAYGLAGLRVGYSVSHPGVADVLNRLRQPFNVNAVALAGATAALQDRDHLARVVELACSGRETLAAGLQRLGLEVTPSAGNFLLVRVGHAAGVYDALLRRGLIVRPLAGYELPEHLRITIGTPEQNTRLLRELPAALRSCIP